MVRILLDALLIELLRLIFQSVVFAKKDYKKRKSKRLKGSRHNLKRDYYENLQKSSSRSS